MDKKDRNEWKQIIKIQTDSTIFNLLKKKQ